MRFDNRPNPGPVSTRKEAAKEQLELSFLAK